MSPPAAQGPRSSSPGTAGDRGKSHGVRLHCGMTFAPGRRTLNGRTMCVMASTMELRDADARHHYGGDHRRLSVIDHLGEFVARSLRSTDDAWDPRFIERMQPLLDAAMAYFDAEVRGFEHLPSTGPALIVANHSGGVYMPDFWALLRHWVREPWVQRAALLARIRLPLRDPRLPITCATGRLRAR